MFIRQCSVLNNGRRHAYWALVESYRTASLLFTTCSLLVQQLLIAKRDLRLPKMIKQLSSFEGLIIDALVSEQATIFVL
jgi:DNA replication protein DnaC